MLESDDMRFSVYCVAIGFGPTPTLIANLALRMQNLPAKIEIVTVAPLLARAIANIHRNESVSSLFLEP